MNGLYISLSEYENPYKNAHRKIKDKIHKYINLTTQTLYIFDIHNTIKYDNEEIDINIKTIIDQLIENNKQIIFLSYDRDKNRMMNNEKILDEKCGYKNIPKIFIEFKEKGFIVKCIEELTKTIIFIDDQEENIKNVLKYVPQTITHKYLNHKNKDHKENLDELIKKIHNTMDV